MERIDSDRLDYNEKITNNGKGVSNYITISYEKDNINRVNKMISEYDSLTKEEQEEFKKMINDEQNFISKKKNENIIVINAAKLPVISTLKVNKTPKKARLLKLDTIYKNDNETTEEFLDRKIYLYKEQYNMLTIYNRELISNNCLRLIKNIPIFAYNRKIIKNMEKDCAFYKGRDLTGYIAYQKKLNSIKNAVLNIFKKDDAYKDEDYLCREWIEKNYFNNKYDKRLLKSR